MARIKVTGYLDTDTLDDDQQDPTQTLGLTEEAYLHQFNLFSEYLTEVEFEVDQGDETL